MQKFLVVIPLYNHGGKVAAVIDDVMQLAAGNKEFAGAVHILVVDDGSTDNGASVVQAAMQRYNENAVVLSFVQQERNMGKGKAILRAAAWAQKHDFSHIITIDADGQHLAEDLPEFFRKIEAQPATVWVGERDFTVDNVPKSSKFGRAFSAFWMRLQTGIKKAPDMQSGFRAYPVNLLLNIKFTESRYSFETEVLVRAVWAGFTVGSIPIKVFYPPAAERVSHFAMLYDNIRISILNTRLTIRAMIPLPFSRLGVLDDGQVLKLTPLTALRMLLSESSTPALLAFSTFIAILINMLPTPGFQSIFLLMAIGVFGLNRVWALTISHLCWPPLVIAIDIEAGYFIRHGEFLTEISWQTLGREGAQRLFEWVLGGVIFGPVLACFGASLVYILALYVGRSLNRRGAGIR